MPHSWRRQWQAQYKRGPEVITILLPCIEINCETWQVNLIHYILASRDFGPLK